MSPASPVLARALLFSAILAAAFALYSSVRLPLADHFAAMGDEPSLSQAIELTPGNAKYYIQRAAVSPQTAVADLRRAATLNPHDATPCIALGLFYERNGNFKQAEQHLKEALLRDSGYPPRWSLANFYFRRRQLDLFWHWAADGARIYHGDLAALFKLCLRTGETAESIRQRVVPQRPKAMMEFVVLLMDEKRHQEAVPAALALLDYRRPSDAPVLFRLCHRLLDTGHTGLALDLWNRLAQTGLIPYQPLDAASGRSLTNGEFRLPVSGQAFDWRLEEVDGITNRSGAAGLTFEFSGNQEEDSLLLSQTAPVIPGRQYRLEYQVESELSGSPPRWRVMLSDSAPVTGDGHMDFKTPHSAESVRLELRWRREPGTTRAKGRLVLRSVRLRLLAG